jgi:gamma-glutamyltranspeptidase
MTGVPAGEWPWLSVHEPHRDLSGFRPVVAERGMVSSPHATASTIGIDVLKDGGNAVDAAIATSAALMVTCPMQCGPGGDAFWLIATRDSGITVLDASGRAPVAASAAQLKALGHRSIPLRSGYAVTVPGAVAGWAAANRRYGSRPLTYLLEPAAELAERGVFASRHFVASFRACETRLSASGAINLWNGRAPRLYERIAQPALARTLRAAGSSNGRSIYEGPLARSIADAVSRAGGWLTKSDLGAHASEWVEPLSASFRGLEVFTTPPSTQGFALLAALRCIEAVASFKLERRDPATVHLLVEAVAAALALRDRINDDRSRFAGEASSHWQEMAASFLATFDPDSRSAVAAQSGQRVAKGDTAHLAVVDGAGMAVSLIQSLYFDFGSCIPVPEGGFTLQNRGSGFHLEEGIPGALAPGIRPPSTLMPSIALRDGKPALVFGCMGGDGQMQTQVQLITDLTDGGLDVQQSVSRPRWYLDRSSGEETVVLLECGADQSIVEGLVSRGHRVRVVGPSEDVMGHVQAISLERGGAMVGAADPRSDGQAAGY